MRGLGNAIGNALPRDTAHLRRVQMMHEGLERFALRATDGRNAGGAGAVDSDGSRHGSTPVRLAGGARRAPYPDDTGARHGSSLPSQTFASFLLWDCPNRCTGPVRVPLGRGLPNRL